MVTESAPSYSGLGQRWQSLWRRIRRDRYLILLVVPGVVFYLVFHYAPMYGVTIAFKDYSAAKGIIGSPWLGFDWFEDFFASIFFWRLLRNTVLLSTYTLVFGFPVPIIFALILNEFQGVFKKTVQTISYLPHFISLVVIVGIMFNLLSVNDGIVNTVMERLGRARVDFMGSPQWFRPLYVSSVIWRNFGFSSIVYLAALSAIDPQLYESARIDGANRWQQAWHVTLPGILPTAMIVLILRLGNLLSVGFEQIILMYSPQTYETADVISTYVYRRGILGSQYSFAAAVGLFNAAINFVLLITANSISKRITQIGLW